MSLNNFLSYLQQLITMTEEKNPYSIALAQTALNAVVELARASGKVDAKTIRVMIEAQHEFRFFTEHKNAYAGVPGEYKENEVKRRRLLMALQPGC